MVRSKHGEEKRTRISRRRGGERRIPEHEEGRVEYRRVERSKKEMEKGLRKRRREETRKDGEQEGEQGEEWGEREELTGEDRRGETQMTDVKRGENEEKRRRKESK